MTANEICVVHLVRHSNDLAAFQGFLDSYRRFPAGVPHDLLIVFKGFPSEEASASHEALLQGVPYKQTRVLDFGYDVRPYVKVSREYAYRYFLFLNSFSQVRTPGWLEMFYRQVQRPGVGLVGATGSYQSIASDYHTFKGDKPRTLPALKRAVLPLYRYIRYTFTIRRHFPTFPNYHIRTNAFMIARDTMVGLSTEIVLHKWNAYRFESSKEGMTHQIMSGGLQPIVVGADGQGYEPPDWPHARTFWISRQENLVISDNQTRSYEEGSQALRERLAFHAWRRYPDGRPRTDVPPLPEPARTPVPSAARR